MDRCSRQGIAPPGVILRRQNGVRVTRRYPKKVKLMYPKKVKLMMYHLYSNVGRAGVSALRHRRSEI